MIIHDQVDQGSADWGNLRAGKVTASEVDALISPLGKVRDSEGVTTYLNKKLVEKWTGGPDLSLVGSFDVEQGIILEERARPAFVLHTGIEVRKVAFIEGHDHRIGCSPDGFVDGVTGAELKCPTMPVHIGYLLDGKLPKAYVAQVQFSMFVTGFKLWHFFSYHRKLPPFHLLVDRDEKFQVAIGDALSGFLDRMDDAYARLVEINGGEPARPPAPKPTTLIDPDDYKV